MMISFLVFLFGLFLVLGAYLLATRGTDARRARLRQRLTEALLHSAHTEDIEVVLARNELMSEIPWMNRVLVRLQAAMRLKQMLDLPADFDLRLADALTDETLPPAPVFAPRVASIESAMRTADWASFTRDAVKWPVIMMTGVIWLGPLVERSRRTKSMPSSGCISRSVMMMSTGWLRRICIPSAPSLASTMCRAPSARRISANITRMWWLSSTSRIFRRS